MHYMSPLVKQDSISVAFHYATLITTYCVFDHSSLIKRELTVTLDFHAGQHAKIVQRGHITHLLNYCPLTTVTSLLRHILLRSLTSNIWRSFGASSGLSRQYGQPKASKS